ncbi:DoxX family protein [Taklimakanibacter deserti]|uniref:DoxX family protein n=1 Tax=Taklimakanibacter deserti TaxID=2267839 RepID=UPI0013C3FA1A
MGILSEVLNVHDTVDVLRILCGLFFIPHVAGKLFEPAALGFFQTAGFKPPKFWMYTAGVVEAILTVLLVFGLFSPWAAVVATVHLCIVAGAIYRVSHGKWLWNIGGNEYAVFWALCCALVAIHD